MSVAGFKLNNFNPFIGAAVAQSVGTCLGKLELPGHCYTAAYKFLDRTEHALLPIAISA